MAFAWQNWHFVSCVQLFNEEKVDRYLNKYKLFAKVLKMLPEAVGLGQHFQARGHSFSPYGPTLSR